MGRRIQDRETILQTHFIDMYRIGPLDLVATTTGEVERLSRFVAWNKIIIIMIAFLSVLDIVCLI